MPSNRTKRVGSGITESHVAETWLGESEVSDGLLALSRELSEQGLRPWGWHARTIAAVRIRWREIIADRPTDTNDHSARALFNKRFRERDTEAWYIREIVTTATCVEHAIANARPWEAVARAMQIGELLAEFRLKGFDPIVEAGRRHLRGRQSATQSNRKSSSAVRIEAVKLLRSKGHSLSRAFAIVARSHGVTAHAVKKDWYLEQLTTAER